MIIEPDPRPGPKGESALALLQAVYRDPDTPLSVRIKCAVEALPYETPKLSATAILSDEDFASRLERAILRSGVKAIDAEAVALPQPE